MPFHLGNELVDLTQPPRRGRAALWCSVVLGVFAFGCDEPDPMLLKISRDPIQNKTAPATMEVALIPSGGVAMNGIVYVAAGETPHPSIVLLHGFPGNEQSLDLAQALRRLGWNTLTFHYRGAWGSPGTFSFTHAIEDAAAAVAFLRDPANAKRYRIDPKKIVVIGHSLGGFIAAQVAFADPSIAAFGAIAPWTIHVDAEIWAKASTVKLAEEAKAMQPDTIPLAGCTPAGLIEEVVAHRSAWNIVQQAPQIGSRPVLVVTADDGGRDETHVFADALRRTARVTEHHISTDHAFSDRRIALQVAVGRWLATLR